MTSTHSWLLPMNWVFTSLILLTIGQTAVCGFGVVMAISYIGRIIYLFRLFGSVIPYKVSVGFEVAHLFFVFLGVIFSKAGVDWLSILFTLLFCTIVCGLYVIDDRFYLYVVADDNSEEEEGDTKS